MALTEPLQPPFYYPRPVKTGRPYSQQLDEIRFNSEIGGILARAAGIHEASTTIGDSALQGMEFGISSFHNKFRVIYDDDAGSFVIQRNSGTTSVPSWQDDFTITSAGVVTSGVNDHGGLTGLSDDDHPQYARKAASENTFTGIITAEAFYIPGTGQIVSGVEDHGALTGLSDDDHPQYARKAASENTFTGIITAEAFYTPSGEFTTDHGNLSGLTDDDHTQYILVNGSRAFTGNQSFGNNDISNIGLIVGDQTFTGQITAESFYLANGGEITSGGLGNVVEDATPQLGGNLDCQGNSIVDASQGFVVIGQSLQVDDTLLVANIATAEAFYVPGNGPEIYAKAGTTGHIHSDLFHVEQFLNFAGQSNDPAGPASNYGRIWVRGSDNRPYYKDDAGAVFPLLLPNIVVAEAFYTPTWDYSESTVQFDIPTAAVDNYWIHNFADQAFTINSVEIISQSGTCTASFYIHGDGERTPGVSITGLDPISVSSTKGSSTATGENVVSVGDSIVLSIPANSSAIHVRGRLQISLT